MLTRLTIQNFQSLQDIRLELGRFTALVGRSSSGKSAVVRALQLLAHNARGTSYVTEGESHTLVAATFGTHAVAVRRGAKTSEYIVNSDDAPQETFTKCGTSVPAEVAALMRFAEVEGTDLNFAGQFDPPFLLDVPGSKVAKVLGDLTQVNLLYAASREANRRRREVGGKVKATEEEIDRLKAALQGYRDLPGQAATLEQVRRSRQAAAERLDRATALRSTADTHERASEALRLISERQSALVQIPRAALDDLAAKLTRGDALAKAANDVDYHAERAETLQAEAQALQVTSVEQVDAIQRRAQRADELRRTADQIGASESRERGLRVDADELIEEAQAHRDYIEALLIEHGVCPTCGQVTAKENA